MILMAKKKRTMTVEQMLEMEQRGAGPTEIARASGLSRARVRAILACGPDKGVRGKDRAGRVVSR